MFLHCKCWKNRRRSWPRCVSVPNSCWTSWPRATRPPLPPENPNTGYEHRSRTSEEYGEVEPGYDPNAGLEPEGLPPISPLQDEDAAPMEFDTRSAEIEPADRQTDPPAQPQPFSYQDNSHSPVTDSYSDNPGHPGQASDPSPDFDSTYPEPDDGSARPAESQPQDYPIQNYHAQTVPSSGFTGKCSTATALAPS